MEWLGALMVKSASVWPVAPQDTADVLLNPARLIIF